MADDRLDNAIDAVVRAVDRIERATRSTLSGDAPTTAAAGEAPSAAPASGSEAASPNAAAAAPGPAASSGAPAEVHELVGRIVARTQDLEEHLDAARDLRSEISELVSRLAAAATKPR